MNDTKIIISSMRMLETNPDVYISQKSYASFIFQAKDLRRTFTNLDAAKAFRDDYLREKNISLPHDMFLINTRFRIHYTVSFTLTNGCRLKKTFTDIGEARQWRDWAMLEYGIEIRDKGKNEKKEFSYSQYDTNNRGCLSLSDNGTREILDGIIL